MIHRAARTGSILVLSAGLMLAGPVRLAAQAVEREAPARLEALRVNGMPVPGENKIIGHYGQPEWSARRRFTLGSIYVQPEGQFEAEAGWRQTVAAGRADEHEWSQELEIGLPRRLQLNLESVRRDFRETRPDRHWHQAESTLGLRYAPADWGKLPLNPAVGAGWKANPGAADALQGQLLLATELSPRWHWGTTLLGERQLGGLRRHEVTLASGLGFSVINESLGAGLEVRLSRVTDRLGRQERRSLGPSVQWRPIDELHLNVAPLWGSGRGAPRRELLIFLGFEFGDGADDGDEPRRKAEPAGTRTR